MLERIPSPVPGLHVSRDATSGAFHVTIWNTASATPTLRERLSAAWTYLLHAARCDDDVAIDRKHAPALAAIFSDATDKLDALPFPFLITCACHAEGLYILHDEDEAEFTINHWTVDWFRDSLRGRLAAAWRTITKGTPLNETHLRRDEAEDLARYLRSLT